MRKIKNAPKNKAFFDEHGSGLAAYNVIGYIGQALSGASLAYAVFALMVAQVITEGEGTPAEIGVLVMLAIVVGFFIELSNRVLARPAIKPFVVKVEGEDPETEKRHRTLNRSYLVGLVAIALLSYLFSVVGSIYYGEDSTEAPELVSLDSIANHFADSREITLSVFRKDSATLAAPYDLQLLAAQQAFAADSSAFMLDRANYASCARKKNGYCIKMRRDLLGKVDVARSKLAAVTAEVSRRRLVALGEIMTKRDESLREIRGREDLATTEAKAVNAAAWESQSSSAVFRGIIFIILTVAGQTLFYFVEYLKLQVEAGSEISRELEPNEFWDKPSVIEELRTTAAWRLERGCRRFIRWMFGEPDDDQETEIPYAKLVGYGGNDGPVTNGPVIAVNEGELRSEKLVVDTSIRQCVECGKDYRPKAHNQRFCSTKCKTAYHTKKHNGTPFNPGQYRGRKKSKV